MCALFVAYFKKGCGKVEHVLAVDVLGRCRRVRGKDRTGQDSRDELFTSLSLPGSPASPDNFVPEFSGGCKPIFQLIYLLQFVF